MNARRGYVTFSADGKDYALRFGANQMAAAEDALGLPFGQIIDKLNDPTGKTVRALREKFGMSQDEFARLTQVGRVTVARWEAVDGKVQFRGKGTRETFRAAALFRRGRGAGTGEKPHPLFFLSSNRCFVPALAETLPRQHNFCG